MTKLQQMLDDKQARAEADQQMRDRVASEVDEMMDNGVRINPLLREMYGGEHAAEAAAVSPELSPAGATKRKISEQLVPTPADDTPVAASAAPHAAKRGRVIVESDDED